jgi:sialate O-acetylesterase
MTAVGEVRASADRQAPALRRSGKLILVLSLAWLVASSAWAAAVRFAPIFNDGVVLQCEMAVNVWGWAAPGVRVELRLDGRAAATAVADASGRWLAVLPAQSPGGAHALEAAAGTDVTKVSEVWFGEVWLASGQSNMVQPLKNSHGGEARLALTLPEIRFVKVPQRTGLPVERELTAEDLAWRPFAPPQNQQIASVAFYFAEQLQQATGRRIGIVQSSYGGTPAQAWTPGWALEARPELEHFTAALSEGRRAGKSKEEWQENAGMLARWKVALADWEKKGQQGPRPKNPGPPHPGNPWYSQSPTVLYEYMIVPIVPYTTRGVIWYQGESNAGKPDEYRVLFPTMIHAWRKVWGRPDWSFLFVQLAAYGARAGDWPGLRAAQAHTRDSVPYTGMAVAIDCGEKEQIHPRAKQPVGERLARLALAQIYGREIVARGPVLETASVGERGISVRFRHVAEGLRTSEGRDEVPGFEVAGSDGKFYPAQARIRLPDRVELRCDAVASPVTLRYAWADWVEPPVTLQNSAGLPAEPFLTAVPTRSPRR